MKFGDFARSGMILSFIRDDHLPMHVQLFDFAQGHAGNRKILIFGLVVIFYIENNIEKKNKKTTTRFSNIDTYVNKVKH